MAGKKTSRSSKTDHVLNLLAGSSPESAPQSAPAQQQAAHPEPPASKPEPQQRPEPVRSAEPRLSPPILEVARASNEALEQTIHGALEQALEDALAEEAAAALPANDPQQGTDIDQVPAELSVPAAEIAAEPAAPTEPPAESEPEPVVPAEPPEEAAAPQTAAPVAFSLQPEEEYISLPDGSRFVNVMSLLVSEKLERYVALFHLCDCPRCLADAQALALSRLPAKYVVLAGSAYPPMMNLYRAKFDSMVTAQVVYACKQIMDSPRHQQAQ